MHWWKQQRARTTAFARKIQDETGPALGQELTPERGLKTEQLDLNRKSSVKSKPERTCSWPTHRLTRPNRKIGKDRIGKGFRADENESLALDSKQRRCLARANRAGKTIGLGWLKIKREIQISEALGAPTRGNRDPRAGDLGDEERTGAEHPGGANKNPSWCTRQQKGFGANRKNSCTKKVNRKKDSPLEN
jgi:hypothetical protein